MSPMGHDEGELPSPLPPPQSPVASAKRLFEFASGHYVVFAALTIIAVAFIATLFTFGYLAVFDWRLILVIEYTDVLKVGLVATAIFSGLGLFLFVAAISISVLRTKGYAVWEYVVSVILLLGVVALLAYVEYLPAGFLALLLAGWAVFAFVKEFAAPRPRPLWLIAMASLFCFAIFGAGVWVGRNVKETPGFRRDVYRLHGEPIRDVGLVMTTSRYVLLYTGDHSLILPVGEVTEIEARPQHTTD